MGDDFDVELTMAAGYAIWLGFASERASDLIATFEGVQATCEGLRTSPRHWSPG
jgi:hypothetical protein